jgi:hypothetical protein
VFIGLFLRYVADFNSVSPMFFQILKPYDLNIKEKQDGMFENYKPQ